MRRSFCVMQYRCSTNSEQGMGMERTSKADLHIHTTYSDGTASVPQVLAQAVAADLQIVAITDHNTMRGATEARRLARDFGSRWSRHSVFLQLAAVMPIRSPRLDAAAPCFRAAAPMICTARSCATPLAGTARAGARRNISKWAGCRCAGEVYAARDRC